MIIRKLLKDRSFGKVRTNRYIPFHLHLNAYLLILPAEKSYADREVCGSHHSPFTAFPSLCFNSLSEGDFSVFSSPNGFLTSGSGRFEGGNAVRGGALVGVIAG